MLLNFNSKPEYSNLVHFYARTLDVDSALIKKYYPRWKENDQQRLIFLVNRSISGPPNPYFANRFVKPRNSASFSFSS